MFLSMKLLFRLVRMLYALSGAAFAGLSWTGRLAFGYGLADLFYDAAHVVGYLLVLGAAWAVGKAEGPEWAPSGQLRGPCYWCLCSCTCASYAGN